MNEKKPPQQNEPRPSASQQRNRPQNPLLSALDVLRTALSTYRSTLFRRLHPLQAPRNPPKSLLDVTKLR